MSTTKAPRNGQPALPQSRTGWLGAIVLLFIAVSCVVTLPLSIKRYEGQAGDELRALRAPSWTDPMGTDSLGRSVMWRCLLGGAVSLSIGAAAAVISVVIGTSWGAVAGYVGGRYDAAMMRIVDVLYGLPYILLVVLLAVAVEGGLDHAPPFLLNLMEGRGGLIRIGTLLVAIGSVSWLTMARVIRGQVLSLRDLPFVEAARACGVGPLRILRSHLLPNLIGPIIVYTTLTIPVSILQESFLSFLGIGVQAPLPSWGNLAAEGMTQLHTLNSSARSVRWWLIFWPCGLLGLTLLALNFLGDALRNRLDPTAIG